MPGKLYNLARVTTATTGTGTITLGSAVSGYLTFALAGVQNGEVVSYGIKDGSNSEVGFGTYTSAGTTLTRTVTASTNSNAAINLSGTAEVYITARAEDFSSVLRVPQGRLTLSSGVPVTTSDITAAQNIYYAPFTGRYCPVYNGVEMVPFNFTSSATDAVGLTLALAGSANWASGSVYDLFYAYASGTLYFGTGPAWSSTTARGTGAGTTELQLYDGVFTNKNSMTLRYGSASTVTIPANQGTYLGSFYANASGQTEDSIASRLLFNAPSVARAMRYAYAKDTGASYSYTTATYREVRGGSTLGTSRVAILLGLSDNAVKAYASHLIDNSSSAGVRTGVGIDSQTTNSATQFGAFSNAAGSEIFAQYYGYPGLGYHVISWLEHSNAVGTTNWTPFISGTTQHGMHVELWQ